jgi:hypothetical protein
MGTRKAGSTPFELASTIYSEIQKTWFIVPRSSSPCPYLQRSSTSPLMSPSYQRRPRASAAASAGTDNPDVDATTFYKRDPTRDLAFGKLISGVPHIAWGACRSCCQSRNACDQFAPSTVGFPGPTFTQVEPQVLLTACQSPVLNNTLQPPEGQHTNRLHLYTFLAGTLA